MYYDEEFSFRSNLLSFNVLQNEELPAEFDAEELAAVEDNIEEDTINEDSSIEFKTVFTRLIEEQMDFLYSMKEKIPEKTMKTVSVDLNIYISFTINTLISMLKIQNMCNEEEITMLVPSLRQACECIIVSLCNSREEYSQLSLEQQHILSEKKINIGNEVMQIYHYLSGVSLMTEDELKESLRRFTSVCCEIENIQF